MGSVSAPFKNILLLYPESGGTPTSIRRSNAHKEHDKNVAMSDKLN
nr:hyp [Cotesia vestalis bracovirus]